MKIVFITVVSYESSKIVENIKNEAKRIGIEEANIYVIENKNSGNGYAWAINQGIKKGMKKKAELFIVANPDISLQGLAKKDFLEAGNHFDVWGFAMKQNGKTYYGGEIDTWRMSGGLITKKPNKRFVKVDYVTGSLVFIKKKVLEKIGLWDERYFLYYEDVDFCFRAKRGGFKIGLDSRIFYDHFETSDKNPRKERLLAKNRLTFFLKYSNMWQKLYELVRIPKTLIELFFGRNFSK